MGATGTLVILVTVLVLGKAQIDPQKLILDCKPGQQKIIGPWSYSDKTCAEVNANRQREYDDTYLAECRRWLNTEVKTIGEANMFECLKTTDGRVRYREEVCCDADTLEHRCFKCDDVRVPYDSLQSAYVSEDCDYKHSVETCSTGQVCLTMHTYNRTDIYVSKGCKDLTDCEALEDDNVNTCRYRNNGTCSYCCKEQFCNHLETPRYLGYYYEFCCYNGGTCMENRTCICPAGYSGDRCERSGCSSGPCKNNAYCQNIGSAPYYKCHCRPQYTGDTCETDADLCSVNTCDNGGTCYSHSYGTRCVCPEDYVGDKCEIPTLKCDYDDMHYTYPYTSISLSNPTTCSGQHKYYKEYLGNWIFLYYCLLHLGHVYKDKLSFRGITEVPDASGYNCERGNTTQWSRFETCCPACFTDPCQNGGWCQSKGQEYVCKCRFGYEGRNCEYRTSMCLISGDPHYTSFDYLTLHPQGICKYNLVSVTKSTLPQFQILGKHELRDGNTLGSFLRYVEIIEGKNVVTLDRHKEVYVNGVQRYPYTVVGPFTIENNGHYVRVVVTLVDSVTKKELEVVVESDGEWITIIKLPPEYKNNVKGICGNFNGVKEDDLTTCDGEDVTDKDNKYSLISNSCQVNDPSDPECTDSDIDPPNCSEDEVLEITDKCEHILGPIFESCTEDLQGHYDGCTFDVCMTNETDSACRSLEALALQCASNGNPVDWREETDCPLPCESPLVYKASASACPATCGQPNALTQCHLPDRESCVCPEETPVLHEDKCITEDECPCITPEGTQIQVGSTWYNTDCSSKYTCEMCADCTIPKLTTDEDPCLSNQVCEQRDGAYGCFNLPDCDQCTLVRNELGYLADLDDETAYYQCTLISEGLWEVVQQYCPSCTEWNQALTACDWDPEHLLTGCPSDGVIHTETTTLYPDGSCRRGAFNAWEHPTDVCQYEQMVHGSRVFRSCAPGTAFNKVSCGCILSALCQGPPPEGKCLTFDQGWNNLGFSGIWIGWSYDGAPSWVSFVTEPGYILNAGHFEKHHLEIPAFSQTAWSNFQISLWFNQAQRTSSRQGLISNGDCISEPSLLIGLTDSGEVEVELRPSSEWAPQAGSLTSLISSQQFATGRWHHVEVKYYQQTLSLTVNYVLQGQVYLEVPPSDAFIKNRCSVLIGVAVDLTTDHPKYFQGLLDEVCFNLDLTDKINGPPLI